MRHVPSRMTAPASLSSCRVLDRRPWRSSRKSSRRTVKQMTCPCRCHRQVSWTFPGSSQLTYPERAPARSRAHATPALGDDDDDEEDETPPPPKKKKTAAKPKAYIPQRGSGPYGILIGLLLSISNPQDTIQVFLTKGELIRAAQPYSDSSYDHSERGNFATAWNGMKTLTSKGYVIVQGSPSRYCLTEDG